MIDLTVQSHWIKGLYLGMCISYHTHNDYSYNFHFTIDFLFIYIEISINDKGK